MDRWLLMASTLLATVGGVSGVLQVLRGERSRWTLAWMTSAFAAQLLFLSIRGQARQACPLADLGEILAFLAWSLTLFYLLVGPAYRISLMGVFTAPVVVVFQGLALLPGVLHADPQPVVGGNVWHETHSATSVLAYGALALAAVAGVMFLVLDHELKEHHLKSGWFRQLPPARELLTSLQRLLWLGMVLLTIGVAAGLRMPRDAAATPHLVAALAVWAAYLVLLLIHKTRGIAGRRLSKCTVLLFLLSLGVFAFV
jgi:ABC-type uncharacterized transport system permease subunit